MMKLKEYSLLLIFCFLSISAAARQDISGYITDFETGKALSDVEIYNNTMGRYYKSNSEGFFLLKDISAGTQNLFFFFPGYEVINKHITVDEDDVVLNISLKKLTVESQLAVTEQAEEIFGIKRLREVEGTAIYAGKKNEVVLPDQMVINTATNNARQIYSQVAGLNIYDSGDAGLQLNIGGRGLNPNRSANFNTRQNGYDISADVLGYPESYYTPPAEAIKEIQIIRGAASLQYGTQFGGLVNFKLKTPHPTKPVELVSRQSTGSNSLFTSFNSLSGTIGEFGYYTYFHYKTGDGFRPNAGFESVNMYSHFNYSLTQKTSLQLELTYLNYLAQQPGGLTDYQFYRNPDVSNRSRNWFEVDWKLAALKLEHNFNDQTKMDAVVFGLNAYRKAIGFRTNRVSQQDDVDAPRDLLIGNFRNGGAEVRLLHRYNLKEMNSVFLIGGKYYQSRNTALQGPGSANSGPEFGLSTDQFPNYPNQSDFKFPNQNMALFGENIFYLSDSFSLTPGFRFEYIKTKSKGTYKRINFDLAGNPIQNESFEDNRIFDRSFVLFGLGMSYYPNNSTEIYSNFSQNYRSVTFTDIRVVNPSFQIDPHISDEKGFTADFGLRGRFSQVISYDIGGFGILYDDRLGEVLKAEMRENASGDMMETGRVIRYRGNIGRALMYGMESLVEWDVSNTFGKNSRMYKLNIFVNNAFTKSRYLESEINGVEGNEVEFIPLVNLKAGINFGIRNLSGSLQYTFLSEQFTDASNARQNRNDNQSGIQGEIPAYEIFDLSLSYSFKKLKLETGINNFLNKDYFTRRATGYPGPGIIPSPPRTFYATIQLTL